MGTELGDLPHECQADQRRFYRRQRYNRDSPRLRSSKFVRIYAESVLRHVVVIKNINQSLLTGATGCEGICSKINVAEFLRVLMPDAIFYEKIYARKSSL